MELLDVALRIILLNLDVIISSILLTRLLGTDVTLIEKHALTSGSTFHAAGLVGVLRSNANITQLLRDSVDLYDRLEKEEGCGWKRNGGLRIACSQERMIELKRLATMAKSFGLDMQILTPSQAKDLWPLMDISGWLIFFECSN